MEHYRTRNKNAGNNAGKNAGILLASVCQKMLVVQFKIRKLMLIIPYATEMNCLKYEQS